MFPKPLHFQINIYVGIKLTFQWTNCRFSEFEIIMKVIFGLEKCLKDSFINYIRDYLNKLVYSLIVLSSKLFNNFPGLHINLWNLLHRVKPVLIDRIPVGDKYKDDDDCGLK